jgi:glutamate synthase domain-containing protein 2
MINVAREALLSLGCIQAQRCHTGRCPTGVATQDPWLAGGLDPALKSVRLANYLATLRKYTLEMAHACGEVHPALVSLDRLDILDGLSTRPAREVFGYEPGWGARSEEVRAGLLALAH